MLRMYCSCRCSGSPPIATMCSRCAGSLMYARRGVVELQVAAAELVDAAQLLAVGLRQVGPELLDVRIDVMVDRGVPAAVVDHARRRDRELGRLLRERVVAQERERVGEDRLAQRDLVRHAHRRRRVVVRPLLVVELHVQRLALDLGDAAERVDEVHVPGGAPLLAVGDRLQPGVALQRDHLAHGVVLDRTQRVAVDPAGLELRPRGAQAIGSQEAADVIGAERGTRALSHVHTDTAYGAAHEHRWSQRSGRGRRVGSRRGHRARTERCRRQRHDRRSQRGAGQRPGGRDRRGVRQDRRDRPDPGRGGGRVRRPARKACGSASAARA